MGYDRSATMFSPDGHLLQVEYAEKTVRLGSASIGLACSNGVVIITDKRVSDILLIQNSINKIYEVDDHIISTAAGILSDARVLIERAQLISQQHRVTYDSPIEVESVMKEIANTMQSFTQYPGTRPFGVSVMIAGVNSGNHLFVSDVTGNYFAYKAIAIGENDEKIKEALRKNYKDGLGIEDGIKLGLKIFKEVLGKNFDVLRFDAAYITLKDKKLERLEGDALKKYIK